MATIETAPTADALTAKAAEPTPPHSSSSAQDAPNTTSATKATPLSPTSPNDQTPPTSQAGPKVSTSVETPVDASPILSPSSTTPVLEKEEIDFVGNVDVNDDKPTEKDLKRVNDLLLLDVNGQSRPFRDLYLGEGVAPRQLIIFVRHFFCGNCQEFLRTLSSSITPDDLLALPTPTFITVIGCGRPDLIKMYTETTFCPFPIYADPTRKLYEYLSMTRTLDYGKKKPEYMQSNLFFSSVQSIMQSLRTGRNALSGGDFRQVGGEFMFENGEVVWAHRMRNTRDHAEVTELRRVLGLDDTKPPMRKRWSHGIKELKMGKRSSSWSRGRAKSKGAKDKNGSKEGSVKEESIERMVNNSSTV